MAVITYQDFKYRAVSAYLFLLIASLLLFNRLAIYDLANIGSSFIINCLFILIQIGVLSIYFSVKKRAWVNIVDLFIGKGDILFFLCLALYLSPLNFIAFHLISLSISICMVVLQRLIKYNVWEEIPLAGIQSFLLIILMFLSILIGKYSLFSDDKLIVQFLT